MCRKGTQNGLEKNIIIKQINDEKWAWAHLGMNLNSRSNFSLLEHFPNEPIPKKVSVGMRSVLNEFRNKTKLQQPSFILCQIRKTNEVFVLVIVYLLKYVDKWQGNYLNGCRQSVNSRIIRREAELCDPKANFILINNPKLCSCLWVAHSLEHMSVDVGVWN